MRSGALRFLVASALAALAASYSFVAPTSLHRPRAAVAAVPRGFQRSAVTMGNNAAFGIFSPAVIATRWIIGEKPLNKLRGKGISLHSQAITEWCVYVGAPAKTRGMLIKKAKNTGEELGFLV